MYDGIYIYRNIAILKHDQIIQSLWDSLKQNILLMNRTRWLYY